MVGGILNLYKPVGIVSHRMVEIIRAILKVKVGHTGTLDPFARGNMILCWGKATRFTSFFQELPKSYRAWIRFGISTDSYDVLGQMNRFSFQPIDSDTLTDALCSYRGKRNQTIPAFSAAKYQGRRLYQYARNGETTPALKKEVTIHHLDIVAIQPGIFPEVEVILSCSTGTYVRSLAYEIGEQLGIGGYVYGLRREYIGDFSWLDSLAIPETLLKSDELITHSIPIEQALYWLPSAQLNSDAEERLLQGNSVPWFEPLSTEPNQRVKVYSGNHFFGVARFDHEKQILRPEIMVGKDSHDAE